MKISVKTGKIENFRSSFFVLTLFSENKKFESWQKELNKFTGGRLGDVFKSKVFNGDLNETLLVHFKPGSPYKRVLLLGLGKKKDFDADKARRIFGTAVKEAAKYKQKKLAITITGLDITGLSKYDVGLAASEGAILSSYKFKEFKTEKKDSDKPFEELTLFDLKRSKHEELKKGIYQGMMLAIGTTYARDLANMPPNIATPGYLAEAAKKISKESGLKCKVFDKEKMEKMGMNALLGVSKGSEEPPYLVSMEYKCSNKKAKTIAVVGKGITFDAGGISLKPSNKMEEMKFDMCGAAAVMGLMKIISDLKPDVNVTGVIAASENLPSGSAQKPSDVVTAYNGKTIEIINTDAEGRLVLADALAYTVDKIKPHAVIDIATLTGAVIVALGHYATGMLGNTPSLIKKLSNAGKKSGEMVWELPIYPEFDKHLESDTADLKNSGSRDAGTIFGACFLQNFVGKTPWVHLDIAGTAWGVTEKTYLPKGPTGVGVRLIGRMLLDWE